jgi:hypothetical protein
LIRYLINPDSGFNTVLFDAEKLERYLTMCEQLNNGPQAPGETAKVLAAAERTPPIHVSDRLQPPYEFLRWRFADEHLKQLGQLIKTRRAIATTVGPNFDIGVSLASLATAEQFHRDLSQSVHETRVDALYMYPKS